jgi:glycine oxidase
VTRAFDVVVVGDGAVGLMTARELARSAPDLTIAVIGTGGRPAAASSAAGAMLGCFGEVTGSTTASAAGRARFALQMSAHRLWPSLLAELEDMAGIRPIRTASDTYVIMNARGGVEDSENYDAMRRALVEHAEPHTEVEEVPALRPHPAARPLRALHLPGEGAVDAAAMLDALVADTSRLGVEHLTATVQRLLNGTAGMTGVELADGEVVAAGHVVVATGAFTTPLLDASFPGHGIQPVLAGSGVATVVDRVLGDPFTSAVRTVNRAGSCGLHLVPLGNGREYVGATNVIFRQPETRPHLGVVQFLSQSALEQLDTNLSYSRIDEIRVGNRPVPIDTFPLLGRGPEDGLTILTGGYRDGLHAAPAIAALATTLVLAGRDDFPSELRPGRRPISTLTVEESIEAFCRQQIGSAVEGGARTTPFLTFDDLGGVFRTMARRLYEDLNVTHGLHPDVVNYLCLTRKSDADLDAARTYIKMVDA